MKSNLSKYLLLSSSGLLLCFLVRKTVLDFNLPFVQNFAQEFFRFGLFGLLGFFAVAGVTVYLFKPYKKHPLLFSIILSGIASNILEKLIFGYVLDYIFVGIGVANLADLFIYFSVISILFLELYNPNKSL
jgi:lipoprotein signal peptidase